MSEILRIKEPADRVPLSLSSDGEWLAFSLGGKSPSSQSRGVSPAVAGNSQWVCHLDTMQPIQLAPAASSSWSGTWSPDGTTLAFYSDRNGNAQLWLWFRETQVLRCAAEVTVTPYFGLKKPLWTKDGKYVIVKTLANEEAVNEDKRQLERVQFYSTSESQKSEDTNDWIHKYKGNISRINILDGSISDLYIGAHPLGLIMSNDGRYIAFTYCLGQEGADSQQLLYDLWICDLEGEKPPLKAATRLKLNSGVTFSWSLNDQSIYCLTSDGKLLMIHIDNDENKQTNLMTFSQGGDYDIPVPLTNGDILIAVGKQLWLYIAEKYEAVDLMRELNREIVSVFSTISSETILVQTFEQSEDLYGFWAFDIKTRECKKIIEEPKMHWHWIEGGAIADDRRLIFFSQSAIEPPALQVYSLLSKSKLGAIELSNLSKSFGNVEMLTWKVNNRTARGVLLLPPETKSPVPVIVRVYGGTEQSRSIRSFGLCNGQVDNHHLFASKGFAVYLPDLVLERQHEPVQEIVTCLEEAIQELLKHPYIDSDRIGIIGHSFGGYSALAAITKLPYFKAAVISSAIGSLVSHSTFYEPEHPDFRTGWTENGQGNMGATLWEERERYIRNSPLFDFDKIDCPVLIIQGKRDRSCYPESGSIFAALRRLGKTAAMALYDEDHWQGSWSEENIEDYYERCTGWFRRYLQER